MSRFTVGNFLGHVAENYRGRTLLCLRMSQVGKKIMDKKGVSRFSVGNFLSQIAEKHRGRTLLCFRNVLESKLFWIIAVSRFCRSFLSHSTETFRRRPLFLRNVLVSKTFGE